MDRGDPCKPDDIEPEHSLLTWEKWVKIRKKQVTKLGEATNRPTADLVMNLCENVREDKERKEVLENAQLTRKLTNCRGTLWERPEALKQECPCQPRYELHRTATDKGRPPIIEHIGVPRDVLEDEKCLVGPTQRKQHNALNADYKKYRHAREVKLYAKIKKIDPYRPLMEGLIVRGCKPKPPPKPKIPPPEVIILDPVVSPEDDNGVCALRINNTIILKKFPNQSVPHIEKMQEESWHEKCTSWNYYFNAPVKRVGRCKLTLTNLGTVTLRYCWKKIRKQIPYIPEVLYEQVFYFNKNEDVVFPGQSKLINFTFVSEKPGIFSEFWELSICNIVFFENTTDKLLINLYGDSVEKMHISTKRIDNLKRKIKDEAFYYSIYKMLVDLIDIATAPEVELVPYKNVYVEGDIFVTRNPVCFYHQSEVQKMKDMYAEMVPGHEWNLYISTTWRRAMMEQEYEERMMYYSRLKESYRDLLKPFYEGESLLTQKHRAVQVILGKLADQFDKEYTRLMVAHCLPLESSDDNLFGNQTVGNLFYIHMQEHVAYTMEVRKHFGIRACWTRGGVVHVRLPDGSTVKISSSQQLNDLCAKHPSTADTPSSRSVQRPQPPIGPSGNKATGEKKPPATRSRVAAASTHRSER